jgi:hypothetical protein
MNNCKNKTMHIEKIISVIRDTPYAFTVEVQPSEEGVLYRATADQQERLLDGTIPGYIEFDEKGNVLPDEQFAHGFSKEIADAVWRGIKEQVIQDHPPFSEP